MSTITTEQSIRERPILFNAAMVQAVLAGRKTQTRRVLKKQPLDVLSMLDDLAGKAWVTLDARGDTPDGNRGSHIRCRYGVPGDRLWVRETWHQHYQGDVLGGRPCYKADGCIHADTLGWKPSIHMPRWASRITLEIVSVRVERVQNITPNGAIAEGVVEWATKERERRIFDKSGNRRIEPLAEDVFDGTKRDLPYLVNAYAELWDSINAKRGYSWESNPWVWVLEFKRIPTQEDTQ